MVFVLPDCGIFFRLHRRAYRGTRVELSGGVPRGGDGCVYGVWAGEFEQRNLEDADMEHDDQGSGRWAAVWPVDSGDVWVAMAEVTATRQRNKEERAFAPEAPLRDDGVAGFGRPRVSGRGGRGRDCRRRWLR